MPTITNNEKFNEINQTINEFIYFDEFNDGFKLLEELKKYIAANNFQQIDTKLYNNYLILIAKLQWLCLPTLTPKEVSSLCENYFNLGLKMENFDLWGKLKVFLFTFEMHEDRDKFKQEIRRILESNKQLITSAKLQGDRSPTIENWLKSYISFVGLGKVETIKIQQFLNENNDVKKISPGEKNILLKLLQFYEKLKLSSLTVAGVEETIPVSTPQFKGYIRDGKLEKETFLTSGQRRILNIVSGLDPNHNFFELQTEKSKYNPGSLESKTIDENLNKKDKLDGLRKVADSYKPGSLQQRAIEEEIRKLGGG